MTFRSVQPSRNIEKNSSPSPASKQPSLSATRTRQFVIGPYRMKKCARRFSSSGGNDVPVAISNAAGAAKYHGLGGATAHDWVVCVVAVDFQIKDPHIRAS